jgi:hypothetical protein
VSAREGREAIYFLSFNNNKLIVYQMRPLSLLCFCGNPIEFIFSRVQVRAYRLWLRDEGITEFGDNLCVPNGTEARERRHAAESIGFKLDSHCVSDSLLMTTHTRILNVKMCYYYTLVSSEINKYISNLHPPDHPQPVSQSKE